MHSRFSQGYYSSSTPSAMYTDYRNYTRHGLLNYSPPYITTANIHVTNTNAVRSNRLPDLKATIDSTREAHEQKSTAVAKTSPMFGSNDPANHFRPAAARLDKASAIATAKVKSVHWSANAYSRDVSTKKGILRHPNLVPEYNRNTQSTTFTLQVRFGDICRVITYREARLRANLLLLFEAQLVSRFPEASRTALTDALNAGYALVMFTRGFRKRTPIAIRGTTAVFPKASFTGFLNCVHDGALVLVEWA
jgi:hypothetical protein